MLNARIQGFYNTLFSRLVISAVAIAVGGVLLLFIVRSITRPLATVSGLMGRLAGGDLAIKVPQTNRCDEIGVLADSLEVFHKSAIERDAIQKKELERAATDKARSELVQKLTANFEHKTQSIVASV